MAVLPLLVVPLFHTIALLLNDVVPLITLSADIQAAVDVVAMAVSMAALGIISTRYKTKKKRYSYLLVCGGFSALLTLIYLYNIYLPA